uniref:Uncharacterized protein n=1 Tax=viral metagenome TaxID=1070528 RepID=A0A6C0KG82_9ZZZZ
MIKKMLLEAWGCKHQSRPSHHCFNATVTKGVQRSANNDGPQLLSLHTPRGFHFRF